jgi:ADP-heptose:LPS heptosyltransferase
VNARFEPGPARRGSPARSFERAAKRRLSRLLAAIVRPRPIGAAQLATLDVRRLLVLRPHNQLGDMVCALPALAALRRAWPRARLVFVASPLAEDLLRDHPDVDELIVLQKEDLWRPWRAMHLLRRLRVPRADLAVVMNTVSFSTTSALAAWVSGARWRAGGSSLPFGSHLSRAVYHLELPAAPADVHEVEHGLAPLRGLGIQAPWATPRLVADAAVLARVDATLATRVPGDGPLVVAHVGAGKLPNIWPAEHFAAVLDVLRREHAARIVLVEGPRDAASVDAVAARLAAAVRWRAPLAESLALFGRARLVIANDTGMAHIAAAAGAPTIVLFGPTDARRWRPPGANVVVVQSPTRSIADLSVDAVLDAVRAVLARPRPIPQTLRTDEYGGIRRGHD